MARRSNPRWMDRIMEIAQDALKKEEGWDRGGRGESENFSQPLLLLYHIFGKNSHQENPDFACGKNWFKLGKLPALNTVKAG